MPAPLTDGGAQVAGLVAVDLGRGFTRRLRLRGAGDEGVSWNLARGASINWDAVLDSVDEWVAENGEDAGRLSE